MRHATFARLALAASLATVLFACSKPGTDHPNSQVAVKVNGDEITISQLNYALSRMGVANEQQAEQAQRDALNNLVNLNLLAKKAVQKRLDRDPSVLQALQASRQQVLAQAYINDVVQRSGLSNPGADEIRKYYDTHPDLFAKRRIYYLRRISIEDTPDKVQSAKERLDRAKSGKPVIDWLDSQDIHFTAREETKPAEDLPLSLLPKLDHLENGGILNVDAAGSKHVLQAIQLLKTEEQPLTQKQAFPMIARYLVNKKRMELTQAEIKRLRDSATIQYVGSFAQSTTGETPVAARTALPDDGKHSDSSHMDKGLAGLK